MILMKLLVAINCPTREIPVGVISLSSDKRKWIFIKNTPFYGFIVPYPGDKIYHISMNFRVYFSNPMGQWVKRPQALKSLNPCGFSLVLSNQPHGFRFIIRSFSMFVKPDHPKNQYLQEMISKAMPCRFSDRAVNGKGGQLLRVVFGAAFISNGS